MICNKQTNKRTLWCPVMLHSCQKGRMLYVSKGVLAGRDTITTLAKSHKLH